MRKKIAKFLFRWAKRVDPDVRVYYVKVSRDLDGVQELGLKEQLGLKDAISEALIREGFIDYTRRVVESKNITTIEGVVNVIK